MVEIAVFEPQQFQPLEDIVTGHAPSFAMSSPCPQSAPHYRKSRE
jgi:hypothetical protein